MQVRERGERKDTACSDEKRDGVRLCSVESIANGFVACSVPPMVFFMVKTAGTQANARCELKGKENQVVIA